MTWAGHLGKNIGTAIPWRELPYRLRILRAVATAGWLLAMGALLTVGAIETAALQRPRTPAGACIYPHDIKATIRCFGRGQERVYRIARPLMIGSFGVTFVLFGIYSRAERRWNDKRQRAGLEAIWRRIDARDTGETQS